MASVDHDAVERDALLGKREREFEVLWVRCVIQVDRDRN